MKKFITLLIASLPILSGCVGSTAIDVCDHAVLKEYPSGIIEVVITHREWGGFLGREGYIGFEPNHYSAILRGEGPIFMNPDFADNPSDIHCVGTISLDRERNKVVVNMKRIVSKPGEPEKTKPHPANGTYPIQSTRKVKPGEP